MMHEVTFLILLQVLRSWSTILFLDEDYLSLIYRLSCEVGWLAGGPSGGSSQLLGFVQGRFYGFYFQSLFVKGLLWQVIIKNQLI